MGEACSQVFVWCTKYIFSLSSCSFPLCPLLHAGPYICSCLQLSGIRNVQTMFQGPSMGICFKLQSELQWTKSPRHQNSRGTKAEEGDQVSSRAWDCELPGEQRTRQKTFFDVREKWNVSTIRGSVFTTVYKPRKLSSILTDSNAEFCSHTTVQECMHYSTQMSHTEWAKHGHLRMV